MNCEQLQARVLVETASAPQQAESVQMSEDSHRHGPTAPVPDHVDCVSDWSTTSPSFDHEKVEGSYGSDYDCVLSSMTVHPVDSEDECSIISEISCDYATEHCPLHDAVLDFPLDDVHDSLSRIGHDRGHDQRLLTSLPTMIPSSCRSGTFVSTVDDDDDVTMCTFTSTFSSCDSTCHFDYLPNELVCVISSYLDVESLSRLRLVNKRLLFVASQDESGWKHHCQCLFSRKAHVANDAYTLLNDGSARKAYHFAARDAVWRHHLLRDELVYSPSTKKGFIWSFRFKAAAGPAWTLLDPWWTGETGKAREMVFLEDGTVMEYIRGKDGNFDTDSLVIPFQDPQTRPLGLKTRWRFISRGLDLPERPEGAYIRINISGRDVPTYVVHRSPSQNWGFVMENCWSVYTSFQLAPRRRPNPFHIDQRPVRMRLRRVSHGGARWLNVADMESEDDGDDDDDTETGDSRPCLEHFNVIEDSTLSVGTAWQRREVFLYNHGVNSLPEGDTAIAEFDRLWNQRQLPAS